MLCALRAHLEFVGKLDMSATVISYPALGLAMPPIPTGTQQWLVQAVRAEGHALAEWGIIFCTDTHLLRMNQQHLDHDTYTDILTFDYSHDYSQENAIVGESYISYCRVQAHARQYGVPVGEELCRVMLHGLLHVCGHKDATVSLRAAMRSTEDRNLQRHPMRGMFHVKHPPQNNNTHRTQTKQPQ